MICGRCQTIFTNINSADQDSNSEIHSLYEHYYDGASFNMRPAAATSLKRLVRDCEVYRQTGRWLDIGYGEGGLLRIVGDGGWECFGTELSPSALAFGASLGWVVSADAERDERFPAGGFDVVTMIEFIEHIAIPSDALQLAARLLRPGGLLYLTTPNAASLNRRLLGLEWSVFSPPEHVTIWSARGIETALMKAGLSVRNVRTEGLNPGELMKRWRRPRASDENTTEPSRNDMAFALNEVMTASPLRRVLKRAINQTLSIGGIGDSLKVWAVKGNLKA